VTCPLCAGIVLLSCLWSAEEQAPGPSEAVWAARYGPAVVRQRNFQFRDVVSAATTVEALVMTEDGRPGMEELPGAWVESSRLLRGKSADKVRNFARRTDVYDNGPDGLLDYTAAYAFRFRQGEKVLILMVDECLSLVGPSITEGRKRTAGERLFLTRAGRKVLLALLRSVFGPKVRSRC